MAPKKPVGNVVARTTGKVVEETVKVAVVEDGEESIEQTANDLTGGEDVSPVKEIIIREKGSEQRQQEQTVEKLPPPREQAHPRKQAEEGGKRRERVVRGIGKGRKARKEEKKRGRKRRRGSTATADGGEGYKAYIYRVLRQVHPDLGISRMAMTVMNNFMADMFERLAREASQLSRYADKMTLSSLEVQGR